MEIVQNISSDQDEPMIKFMKYMEALRTIEKLPKNMAIPTIVPQSRVESIPIAQPLFELNDTNKKAMSIVEEYLERKYGDQSEINELLSSSPEFTQVANPSMEYNMRPPSPTAIARIESSTWTDRSVPETATCDQVTT